MIFNLLRKRQRLVHQATDALPQGVIQPLHVIGLPAGFSHRAMPFRRQHDNIRLPKITVTHRTLAIHWRQRSPEVAGRCRIPCSNRHPNDFPRVAVDGQPHPLLVPFIADERPPFITFDSQPTLFFDRMRTLRGTGRYFSCTYACSQLSETGTARAMPASEMRSSSRRSMMPLISSEMTRQAGSSTNWRPQALPAYFGFPVPFELFLITWSVWQSGQWRMPCSSMLFQGSSTIPCYHSDSRTTA